MSAFDKLPKDVIIYKILPEIQADLLAENAMLKKQLDKVTSRYSKLYDAVSNGYDIRVCQYVSESECDNVIGDCYCECGEIYCDEHLSGCSKCGWK
jgi:hypothetical protein